MSSANERQVLEREMERELTQIEDRLGEGNEADPKGYLGRRCRDPNDYEARAVSYGPPALNDYVRAGLTPRDKR